MLKEVFEIDIDGYVAKKYVKEFDEHGNCKEELADNIITVEIPQGLYHAKWTGKEWVEDMSQEEIVTLNNHPKEPTSEDYLIDLDFRISMLELGL